MWDQGGGSREVSDEVGANSLKNRELTCNMGLEWRKVHILAKRVTIPSRFFCSFKAHISLIYVLQ
jgi:hypothetical protein